MFISATGPHTRKAKLLKQNGLSAPLGCHLCAKRASHRAEGTHNGGQRRARASRLCTTAWYMDLPHCCASGQEAAEAIGICLEEYQMASPLHGQRASKRQAIRKQNFSTNSHRCVPLFPSLPTSHPLQAASLGSGKRKHRETRPTRLHESWSSTWDLHLPRSPDQEVIKRNHHRG